MISEHPISTGFYGLTGYQLDPRIGASHIICCFWKAMLFLSLVLRKLIEVMGIWDTVVCVSGMMMVR